MNVGIVANRVLSGLPSTEADTFPRVRSRFHDVVTDLFEDRSPAGGSVMLVAPHRRAGVSFICGNLAAELAHQGKRCLLVDAQALLGARAFSPNAVAALGQHTSQPGLSILGMHEVAAGASWEEGHGALSTLSALLLHLEQEWGHLVIDAPALSESDTACQLTAFVRGTVLVARRQKTKTSEIEHCQRILKSFGGRVMGAMFNAH